MGAAQNYDAAMLSSPEMQNLMRYKDFQAMVGKQDHRAEKYGYR